MLSENAELGFPLRKDAVLEVAYEWAEDRDMKIWKNKRGDHLAGKKWFKGFLERSDKLVLKKASNLCVSRAMAANTTNLQNWFKIYEDLLESLGIDDPRFIFNVDEKGLGSIPEDVSTKFVGIKGQGLQQVVGSEKAERSTMVTLASTAAECAGGGGCTCPCWYISLCFLSGNWIKPDLYAKNRIDPA